MFNDLQQNWTEDMFYFFIEELITTINKYNFNKPANKVLKVSMPKGNYMKELYRVIRLLKVLPSI
jgi:hypothetical protein